MGRLDDYPMGTQDFLRRVGELLKKKMISSMNSTNLVRGNFFINRYSADYLALIGLLVG